MTTKKFLRTLNWKLWWGVSRAERKELISSYRRFFAENSGRDEAELVAECGDVNLIAGEILAGYSQSALPFLRFLIVGWLWFLAYKMIVRIPFLHNSIRDEDWLWQIFYIILVPVLSLCLVIGKQTRITSRPAKKSLTISFLSVLLLFAGTALVFLFFMDIPVQTILRVENGEPIVFVPFVEETPIYNFYGVFSLTRFLLRVVDVGCLLTILSACFITMMAIKVNIKFSALLPLCGGLMYYLQRYYYLVYCLDFSSSNLAEHYPLLVLPAYLSILVTVIITILFCFGLRFLKRRCAK